MPNSIKMKKLTFIIVGVLFTVTMFGQTYIGGDLNSDGIMQVNETWTYMTTKTVTQAMIDAGTPLVNTVSVTSTEVTARVTATATATTVTTQAPSLAVVKTVDQPTITIPTILHYTTTVTNTGNTSLTNVVVVDSLVVDSLDTFDTTLQVGSHYQGGVIFYLDQTGEHGLIAPITGYIPILRANAQGLYANQAMWGAAPMGGVGTDTILGSGRHNTELMMKTKSAIRPYISAAEFCTNFSVTEGETIYKDWFLPSKDEFIELLKWTVTIPHGGVSENGWWYRSSYFNARFFTSSECMKGDKFYGGAFMPNYVLKYYVWIMQFGYMIPESKGEAVYVIPIRSF